MQKRPLSVIVVSLVYVATGAAGLVFHFADLKPPFHYESLLVAGVRLIAIICGVWMLRGANWARWLALAWIVFHVVLSAFHSWRELAVHALICAAIAYFLLRVPANRYFRTNSGATP